MIVPVNKIIPISVVDGVGSRTAIFLQKCNISCLYCHNPETQNICNSCGACVEKCKAKALSIDKQNNVLWNKEKCINCDNCIYICENNSSPKIMHMNELEVFEEIKKNIPLIRGITVSGGECTLYPEFLINLFKLCKQQNLTCYIDTNGLIDFSKHYHLLEQCDKVMLDVKSWDKDVFYNLTGSYNDTVKKNLVYLAQKHKLEEVRIVCIDDYVDAKETIIGISEMIGNYLDEFTLKLITFRNYGVKGDFANLTSPSYEQMEQLRELAELYGFSNICIV